MKIQQNQIKAIYACGNKLGIVDKQDGHSDELHLIIYKLCQKESVKELTEREAKLVLKELRDMERGHSITYAQTKYIKHLFAELKNLTPSTASDEERLKGIIQKVTGNPPADKNIFSRLTKNQGSQIIEFLKKCIKTEERKKVRGDANGPQ